VGPIDFFESGRILFRCPRRHEFEKRRKEWLLAAEKVARESKTYNMVHLINTMYNEGVATVDMQEWCEEFQQKNPWLFA
jgi:hypothetical protein